MYQAKYEESSKQLQREASAGSAQVLGHARYHPDKEGRLSCSYDIPGVRTEVQVFISKQAASLREGCCQVSTYGF